MKKMLFAAVLLAFAVACSNPKHDGYTINGTLTGITEGQIILSNMSRTDVITDTAEIKDGKFSFIGKVTTPEFYMLTIDGKRMRLFVDNSAITLTANIDSLQNAEVKGSTLGEEIKAMNDQKTALSDAFNEKYQYNTLAREYGSATPERKKEIEGILNSEEVGAARQEMSKKMSDIDSIYMAQNPKSPYTAILLSGKVDSYLNKMGELSAMVDSMAVAPALAGNRYVKEMQDAIVNIKATEVGQQAPDFTQNDPEGNPITFSDVYKKNKITMIDFWASWCGPCRAFNPTLVKIYNKYHNKGFEIFATSFDRPDGKDKWVKAIQDDKLTWIHVSDLQFWDNASGKLYYVRYIPQNVFVDGEGKIIAKRLGEEEIEKFLSENLK